MTPTTTKPKRTTTKRVSKILTAVEKQKTVRQMRRYLLDYLTAYDSADVVFKFSDDEVTELYNKIQGVKA